MAAIFLWLITQNGITAIVLSIAADALAAAPTIVKAYRQPTSESASVFAVSSLSAAITLLTIKQWDFSAYAFPLYIFLICTVIFTLVLLPRFRFAADE